MTDPSPSPLPAKPKLRAVLLYSSGHLGSAITFNLLHKRELEIVGLVRAAPIAAGRGESAWRRMGIFIRKFGFQMSWLMAWQRAVQALAYGLAMVTMPFVKPRFLPGWVLARRLRIPTFHAHNVNDPACANFIRMLAPDVIVSAYFNQILKPEIIALARRGVLNVHPGWLPDYRGAMAYFWVLHNDEQFGGVSVHWIDEGIDTGALLARVRFAITPEMTQHQVLTKTAILGSRALQQVCRMLLRGESPASLIVDTAEARYYSVPDASAFENYFQRRRFFRIRNVFYVLMHGIRTPLK